jgi:hypothetical protein
MWPMVASTTPPMFEAFYGVTRIEREASVMLLQPAAFLCGRSFLKCAANSCSD